MSLPAFESAVSALQDTLCTFYIPNVGDTGVLPDDWGAGVVCYIDKVNIKSSINTADHSAGQNPYPINRATKGDGQLDIEFKYVVSPWQLSFQAPRQIKMVQLSTINSVSKTVTITGIITDVENEIAGPSTYKVTVKPYAVTGQPPVVY